MNYYPFHIGDYVSATRHLSWDEDCAYRRLLDTYYTTEGALPAELRAVCRLVLATTTEQREAVEIVLKEFFELTEAGWVNSRADKEIEVMRGKQEKQRERANKRWAKKPEGGDEQAPSNTGNGNGSTGASAGDEHAAMPRHEESDATASEVHANAMPPTPTPTPTPTPINTPSNEGVTRKRSTTPARPADVPDNVWNDFLAVRKAKRAPLTDTALEGIAREAAKAGLSLADAIAYCCEAGWQGFNAGWYAERRGVGRVPARQQPQSFAQQDREEGMRRWEQMTGETHPDRMPRQGGSVIDLVPVDLVEQQRDQQQLGWQR
ncbi:MAG: YdaU family protein [Delftia acidovorans]|jgi:uncharacterized protein YdaU (DUF1376 family)|nr:YdaU family protein [Delftia acidovorans]